MGNKLPEIIKYVWIVYHIMLSSQGFKQYMRIFDNPENAFQGVISTFILGNSQGEESILIRSSPPTEEEGAAYYAYEIRGEFIRFSIWIERHIVSESDGK